MSSNILLDRSIVWTRGITTTSDCSVGMDRSIVMVIVGRIVRRIVRRVGVGERDEAPTRRRGGPFDIYVSRVLHV
jgi:hypothetical protein